MTLKIMRRVALLMLIVGALAHGQEDVLFAPQAETQFLLGVRQYVQQDFKNAYQTLRQTAELEPMHQRTTAAMIMAAKSANALRLYEESADLCKTFLDRFPYSSYVEDAHYTLGLAYAGLNRTRDAAQEMLVVRASAAVNVTRWRATENLERYVLSFTPDVIRTLEATVTDDSSRVLLLLLRGEAYERRGQKDSAAVVAARVQALTADNILLRRARRLIARDERLPVGDTLTVAVLLPLMNHYAVEKPDGIMAKEILRGILEALREFNADGSRGHAPVKLDVRDTQRESDRLARIIDEWKSDTSVVAILGPLFTDETLTAAGRANAAHIPLVTPTATGNNIASIGEYVFQANPDYAMRGALMAQYAVRSAGAKNIAIITSDLFPASLLADAFAQEVHRSGATLVSFQRYAAGTSDFRHLIRAIKTDASKLSRGVIDAIYCPIASPSEIGVMASQLRALDPTVLVLGSDEWNDDEELDKNKSSADGVVFPSDRWNSDPSNPISGMSFESFGYDAASLVFDCLAKTKGTRDSLRATLSKVLEYDGIHSKISFHNSRVNSSIHILQYKRGFIKKIGEIAYQQ
ncbi:MAG TPA: ABC transporter substrate-binding protein [Bacteroidota bacterium]|nr:ABC transporter substrate-binding protein [Bacteroidota bacterium]